MLFMKTPFHRGLRVTLGLDSHLGPTAFGGEHTGAAAADATAQRLTQQQGDETFTEPLDALSPWLEVRCTVIRYCKLHILSSEVKSPIASHIYALLITFQIEIRQYRNVIRSRQVIKAELLTEAVLCSVLYVQLTRKPL